MRRANGSGAPADIARLGPAPDRATLAAVTLLDALYAFFQEHEHCGDLDSGLDGDRVWMACTCQVRGS
jgi:hypothetical protein